MSADVKSLQARQHELREQLEIVYVERRLAQDELEALRRELLGLEAEIAAVPLELREVGVSDHAVVRYLERVKGVDVEALRQEIRGSVQAKTLNFAPVMMVKSKDGFWLTIRDKVVVTVTERAFPKKRK